MAIAILGMTSLLSAQEPGGMVPRHPISTIDRRTARPASEQRTAGPMSERTTNGPPGPVSPLTRGPLPDPVSHRWLRRWTCARGSLRPAWCGGSDIGAWTNAAIALIGCGEVYIPAGSTSRKQHPEAALRETGWRVWLRNHPDVYGHYRMCSRY